jgi:hypothetical protein
MVGGKSNQGDWITASSLSSEGGCFGDEIAPRLVRGRRGKSLAVVLNHGRPLAIGGLGPPSAAMDGGQVIDRMAEGVSSSFCLNPKECSKEGEIKEFFGQLWWFPSAVKARVSH